METKKANLKLLISNGESYLLEFKTEGSIMTASPKKLSLLRTFPGQVAYWG